MTVSILLGAALAQMIALTIAMSGAWLAQQRSGNSGWIDAVWTFAVGSVGVASALVHLTETAAWPSERQILVATLVGVWAIRLGSHIVSRSASKADDPRYAELIRGWGETAAKSMFVLLQKQALVSLPLTLSIFLAAQNPSVGLAPGDIVAVGLFLIAIGGETLADYQLRNFSRNSLSKGMVCRDGLWRYSRHPNYFFEWVHWLAYPAIAIELDGGYPLGWLSLSAPLMMYWLLRHISGVPPLEAHMVRKHGGAYEHYQLTTSAFFPGIPKHG